MKLLKMKGKLTLYQALLEGKNPLDILRYVSEEFSGKIKLSTSLGWEDQVLTHLIFSNGLPINVFTLDTGRLFNETYSVLSSTIRKYENKIEAYFPEYTEVEKLLSEKGPFSFYDSAENRKECCRIRKVEPLKRALKGVECWVTGLRAEQSENRNNLNVIEWDNTFRLFKVNPLLNWTLDDVKNFINVNNVPYNPLHDKGFVSIGCAPCTRAIKDGEDFRAGRWWWEDNSKKECGLHLTPDPSPKGEGS